MQYYSTTTQSTNTTLLEDIVLQAVHTYVLFVLGWSWNWTRVLSADLSNITKPSNPTLILGSTYLYAGKRGFAMLGLKAH